MAVPAASPALAWAVVAALAPVLLGGLADAYPTGISLVGNAEAGAMPVLTFGTGPASTLASIAVTPDGLAVEDKSGVAGLTISPQQAKIPNLVATGNLSAQSLTMKGKAQFALFDLDSFDAKGADSNAWTPNDHGTCGASHDNFLGGHCRFAATSAKRVYANLPPHTHVRVSARVHFLDKWMGESVVLMVNDNPVWSESHHWCPGFLKWMCTKYGIDSCGRDMPDRLSVKAKATVPHTDPTLSLTFTSNLGRDVDPCYTSWGIDDVSIELL